MSSESKISISTSAPGKIILFGEHSVVYGKLAVAASISSRTTVIISESDKSTVTLHFPKLRHSQEISLSTLNSKLNENLPICIGEDKSQVNVETTNLIDINSLLSISKNDFSLDSSDKNSNRVKTALQVFFFLLRGIFSSTNFLLKPCTIRVQSELTIGAGTGSSASYAVSLAAALLFWLKRQKFSDSNVSKPDFKPFTFDGDATSLSKKDKEIVNKWAYAAERINHGNPSGLDNSICTFGSIVEMNRKSKGSMQILTNTPELNLLLINSGVDRDTSLLVKNVQELKSRHESVVNSILDGMHAVVNEAVEILVKLKALEDGEASEKSITEQYMALEELFDLNHGLLSTLSVSHEKLEHIRAIAAKYALHTKLTGAGGGGYVIALIPPNYPLGNLISCVNELQANGFLSDQVLLGGEGVAVKVLS